MKIVYAECEIGYYTLRGIGDSEASALLSINKAIKNMDGPHKSTQLDEETVNYITCEVGDAFIDWNKVITPVKWKAVDTTGYYPTHEFTATDGDAARQWVKDNLAGNDWIVYNAEDC